MNHRTQGASQDILSWRDATGRTAADWARFRGHEELEGYLTTEAEELKNITVVKSTREAPLGTSPDDASTKDQGVGLKTNSAPRIVDPSKEGTTARPGFHTMHSMASLTKSAPRLGKRDNGHGALGSEI